MADAHQIQWLVNILLTIIVLAVSYFDFRQRRIPNKIVLPGALLGIVLHSMQGVDGFLFAGAGLMCGFFLLLLPYIMQVMGAGDVKFLAAIGSFVGGYGSLRVLLIALLSYPFMAFFFVWQQGKIKITLRRFGQLLSKLFGVIIPPFRLYAEQLKLTDDPQISSATTPFGLAISAGTLIALFSNFLR